jgi:hypothetical protein
MKKISGMTSRNYESKNLCLRLKCKRGKFKGLAWMKFLEKLNYEREKPLLQNAGIKTLPTGVGN